MAILKFAIYNDRSEHIASTLHAEDAAMMVSALDDGSVRYNRRTVWREGVDGFAFESYDEAADTMLKRIADNMFL